MNKKGVNKMNKQLEKINNVSSIILACLLAVGVGALTRSALESANIIKPKSVEVVVKSDVMPLKNGGSILLEKIGAEKIVSMSYEDFEFIGKKKSKIKKLIQNVAGLYARMEE